MFTHTLCSTYLFRGCSDGKSSDLIDNCWACAEVSFREVLGHALEMSANGTGCIPCRLTFRSDECFQDKLDQVLASALDNYQADSHDITVLVSWEVRRPVPADLKVLDDIGEYYAGSMTFYYKGEMMRGLIYENDPPEVTIFNECIAQRTCAATIYYKRPSKE